MFKYNKYLIFIGIGLAMLAGIGSGIGMGQAVAYALEGIARQPEAYDKLIKVLWQGSIYILIPVFLSFILSVIILIRCKPCCQCCCNKQEIRK